MSGRGARRERKRQLAKQAGGQPQNRGGSSGSARSQQQIVHQQVQQLQQFSGPLPLPQMLQGYEDIVPGSAERILKLAEDEALHRRGMERSFVGYRSWALAVSALVVVLILAATVYLTAAGRSIEGVALLIFEITALVTVFLVTQFRGS